MSPKARLESFKSEEFDFAIPPTSSPRILRENLRNHVDVQLLKQELADGQLAEATIRRFVGEMMRRFTPGQRFEFEVALAAVAVVMEDYFAPYAEEFLVDLASLRLNEITMAKRVAGLCLSDRVTRNKTRVYDAKSSCNGFDAETEGWVNTDTVATHRERPAIYAGT